MPEKPNQKPNRWADVKKTELHRHLDCAIRPQTLRELLTEAGESVPKSESDFAERYLVKAPMRDLGTVLNKFLAAQTALSSRAALRRITRECIEDAHAENVEALELRYAPTFICEGHRDLSFDEVHCGIQEGIQDTIHLPIQVGLIAIFQRTKPVAEARSVLDFVLTHREHFCGVDLADNEDGFDARPFEPVFTKAKANGLHITVHAGEAPIASAAENVQVAIERLHAERIGHGIQIANPAIPRSREVLELVLKKGIHLEVCPTSNVLTNAVKSLREHPFEILRKAGVSLSINTDDPGVFDFDLTHEYETLAQTFNLNENDFVEINKVAKNARFI